MAKVHPVWVNRDETKAYLVALARGMRVLVVTPNGPVMAKEIAEHAFRGKAISSELFVYPIVSPHIREVEAVLTGARRVAQKVQLKLYHIQFQSLGLATPSNILVWTTRSRKGAEAFAMDTLPNSTIIKTRILTNPVIVDQAEQALASA